MSLNPRPLKIDEESIVDHFYLKKGDKCFYFGEYTAGAGWKFSETNSLISNLKKGISKMGTPEWKYRNKAIGKIGRLIAPLMKHRKVTRFGFLHLLQKLRPIQTMIQELKMP